MKPNRREILKSIGGVIGASGLTFSSPTLVGDDKLPREAPSSSGTVGLPKNWRSMRKIDVHAHVWQSLHLPDADWSGAEDLVEAAETLGIEKLCCSRPITGGVMADTEKVRDANDSVLAAMKRYPDRIAGFCFVQPGNGPAALAEIDRCVDAGMIGVKLYNQFKYSDPILFPIAERCIAHRIPIIGHSGHVTDAKTKASQPNISDSLDFCMLSERYPELLLIMAHVNGGGDWEWAIKALRACPNVYLDTSGSVLESDTIGMCVQELGHKRILFGTDSTMEGGVGKILSADLTPTQRGDIFWRNLQQILDRRSA
ncbi:amidohydrolase family protein [Fuerstiella marisgermanici]|uniref:Putative metal-dependent hydrolase of the TIM-barrel fold protein n=1 Tax=Fuerstiella marisgermanici TaxID=1891926 RepID=A0A1P8WIM9_9PLAN|nr:amidohydrolase family protein [Fuerstiella marisgermanici]APZ93919.1 putative metal-dependent hydrolase of the TIM-barrel fold protein [Fuerstiella marisgermanici]